MAALSTSGVTTSSFATVETLIPQQVPITIQAAQTLFGPMLYQHYVGWQSSFLGYGGAQFGGSEAYRFELMQTRGSDVLGDVPTLHHYQHFMHFMLRVGSRVIFPWEDQREETSLEANNQDLLERSRATVCGHRLHPGNKDRGFVVCPTCLVRHEIDILERINAAWRLFDQGPNFSILQRIWHYQKRQWRTLVDVIEVTALQEDRWDFEQLDKGISITQAVAGSSRCSEALKEAYKCPNMAQGWDHKFIPNGKRNTRAHRSDSHMCSDSQHEQSPCRPTHAKQGAYNQMTMPATTSQSNGIFRLGRTRARSLSPTVRTADAHLRSPSPTRHATTESADKHSSSSLPRGDLVIPYASRKRVLFAESVLEHVPRTKDQYSRSSRSYEPGRHACRKGYEWLKSDGYTPSGDYSTRDDDKSDKDSNTEDLENDSAIDEDVVMDVNSLTMYDDSRAERHRLDLQHPADTTGLLQGPENAGSMRLESSSLGIRIESLSLDNNSQIVGERVHVGNTTEVAPDNKLIAKGNTKHQDSCIGSAIAKRP